MKRFLILFLMICIAPSQLNAAPFDNESVITLTQMELGDDVILTKIESLPCSYDVSTDAIIALKEAGVSNEVIAAMIARCAGSTSAQGAAPTDSDPALMRDPGIYLDFGKEGAHDLKRIRPTSGNGGRVTGNGSLLFPFKVKVNLAQPSAQTAAPNRTPKFYFYFENDDRDVSDFGVSGSIAAQSPNEFTLARLKVRKGNREITAATAKAFGAQVGLDPKNAIPFQMEEIRTGIFSVELTEELEPGEYAFVLRSGSDTYRFYDFSVN